MNSSSNAMPTNWVTHKTLPARFRPTQTYACAMTQPSVSNLGGARLLINADGTVQTYTSSNGAQAVAGGAYIAKAV